MGNMIVGVVLGVFGSVLAAELLIQENWLADWCVRFSSKMLPASISERYESEWLQVIADIQSPTWKLLNAAALIFAARRIAAQTKSINRYINDRPWWLLQIRCRLRRIRIEVEDGRARGELSYLPILSLVMWYGIRIVPASLRRFDQINAGGFTRDLRFSDRLVEKPKGTFLLAKKVAVFLTLVGIELFIVLPVALARAPIYIVASATDRTPRCG